MRVREKAVGRRGVGSEMAVVVAADSREVVRWERRVWWEALAVVVD